jgi:signal transduction histidine kinase
MRQRGSLVGRLTLVQLTVFAALWLVIIALVVTSMYRSDQGDIQVELGAVAGSLAALAPADTDIAQVERIGREFAAITRQRSDPTMKAEEFAYQIWSADGRLLVRSVESDLPAMPPGPQQPGASSIGAAWYLRGEWNRERTVYAVAATRVGYYQRRVLGTVGGLVGLWLAMAALFAAAFWASFRVVIRPLRELAQRIAARPNDDLSPIDESVAYSEVRPLLAALNHKLARIRALLDSERQFFADAAHELRTPLSVIGAQAHVLAHETELDERLKALRQIEGGIERGAHAVSKLLLLGRLEGAAGPERATHDLGAIAAAAVAALQARAATGKQSLLLVCAEPVMVECDAAQIAALLDNLIDNALRYCPAAAAVEVSVAVESADTVLCVRDNGPGIAAADRERAFDRFQRLGATDTTGSGLGLAIARRIADLHGASITLGEGLDSRGLSVEVRFPRVPRQNQSRIGTPRVSRTRNRPITKVPAATITGYHRPL